MTMNRERPLAEKTVTADEAIRAIKSGDHVVFSHAAGAPQEIHRALVRHKEDYSGVEIFHLICLGSGDYMAPEMEGHFRHCAAFVGANSRRAVAEDRADFIPCFFFEVPGFFRRKLWPVDVAVIHVSPPDLMGNCSFGVSCDYTKPAAEAARIVIAEMNDQMPYIGGDNFIHVSQIDYIVPCSNPLPEVPPAKTGAVEEAIGRYCAELVEDGSTLQLGIGAIPDAVLKCLSDKKDLGLHTEMFADGAIDLIERGVINGSRKTLHPGKHVATFLMGSRRFYDFVNNNPDVEMRPVDYVNNPCVIMKNEKMVSINSCIEVDLMGQVTSECIGLTQFSGTGGQVDYVRGAALADGGKSILAMPSTAAKGTVSRIMPYLSHGAAVTTPRDDVDYIVTEYGIAHLKGKTLKERARLLINIAHPNFRDNLEEEFRKRFKK